MRTFAKHLRVLSFLFTLFVPFAAAQTDAVTLELGKSIERELKGGQAHSYRINGNAGQFMHVVTRQQGIDVVVALFDSGGNRLKEIDSPNGSHGMESLSYVFETVGTFRLVISSLESDAPKGKYSVHMNELRPAVTDDRYFLEGENAEIESRKANDAGTPDSLARGEKLALEAKRLYLLAAKNPDQNGRIAKALNELGRLFVNKANYATALTLHREELRILESFPESGALGRAYNNIGIIFQRQGNASIALEYYSRALANWEKFEDKVGVSSALNNIGIVHMNQGNYPAALDAYRRSVGAKTDDDIADTDVLANIGLVYMELKEYQKALKYLQKSFELTGSRDGSVAADVAKVYRFSGEKEKALEWAKKAISLERPSGTRNLAIANTLAAQASFELNKREESLIFANAAISFNEKMRAAGRLEDSQELFERSLEPYYLKAEILAGQDKALEALSVYERFRSASLLNVLRNGRANRARNIEKSEKDRLAALNAELTSLNSEIIAEKQKDAADRTRLSELERKQKAKRVEFEAFGARFANLTGTGDSIGRSEDFSIDTISSLLDDDTAVLEYMVGDYGITLLFVLTKTTNAGAPALRLFIIDDKVNKVSGFEALVAYRTSLEKGDLSFIEGSKELYRRLIKPAESLLVGKSRIIIVPDAGLWDLPFQSLMDDKGKFLVEKSAVSYAPSLTSLREMIKGRDAKQLARGYELLAFGNPTIGKETAEHAKRVFMNAKLEPIPEAARLVRELSRLYGSQRSKVFIGDDAREETAKTEASKYRIVQFATHGVLNDSSPMYSHLVLSQYKNNPKEDGLLEAWELKDLELNADMVILTACETARGTVSSGEGMIGMTWASFIAGAPTTVASQWKVESSSTTELMLEFHRQLLGKQKISKAEALRRASLKLMKIPKYRHPSYWAGFVLVGDGS